MDVDNDAVPAGADEVQGDQALGSVPAATAGQADSSAEASASLEKRKKVGGPERRPR